MKKKGKILVIDKGETRTYPLRTELGSMWKLEADLGDVKIYKWRRPGSEKRAVIIEDEK